MNEAESLEALFFQWISSAGNCHAAKSPLTAGREFDMIISTKAISPAGKTKGRLFYGDPTV
jgi:hypothetical protein